METRARRDFVSTQFAFTLNAAGSGSGSRDDLILISPFKMTRSAAFLGKIFDYNYFFLCVPSAALLKPQHKKL